MEHSLNETGESASVTFRHIHLSQPEDIGNKLNVCFIIGVGSMSNHQRSNILPCNIRSREPPQYRAAHLEDFFTLFRLPEHHLE